MNNGSQTRLTIVTVTYNSASVIQTMLESIPDMVEVIVVDNASHDATLAMVEKIQQTNELVKLVRLEKNYGFGTACNKGASQATGEFVFFVNPDCQVSKACVDKLVDVADNLKDFGAINPAILTSSGKRAVSQHRYMAKISAAKPYADSDKLASLNIQQVGTLSGSALFFKLATFRMLEGFDERIFLFHEDDDLCRRLSLASLPMFVVNDAEITHLGGQGSGPSKLTFAKQKAFMMAQARAYVEAKHGVSHWRAKSYIRAVLKIISPLTLLSKRKRLQALGHFKGAGSFNLNTYGKPQSD